MKSAEMCTSINVSDLLHAGLLLSTDSIPRLISQILTSHAPCPKFLHKYSNREIMGSFLDIPAKEK